MVAKKVQFQKNEKSEKRTRESWFNEECGKERKDIRSKNRQRNHVGQDLHSTSKKIRSKYGIHSK